MVSYSMSVYTTTKINSLLASKQDANSSIQIKQGLISGTDYTIGTSLILTTVVAGEIIHGIITYNNENYAVNGIMSATNNILFDNGTIKIRQYLNDNNIPVISVYESSTLVVPSAFEGSVIRNIS